MQMKRYANEHGLSMFHYCVWQVKGGHALTKTENLIRIFDWSLLSGCAPALFYKEKRQNIFMLHIGIAES